jgi:hypothetical protein
MLNRLRRPRALPADLVRVHEAFARCAEQVDLAQRAMIRCVPSSSRSMALPLEVGAQTVRLALGEADALMPPWRHPAVETHWSACSAALAQTLSALDDAIVTASATAELEVALTAVQDLLDPLHAFVDTAEAFEAMKTRG